MRRMTDEPERPSEEPERRELEERLRGLEPAPLRDACRQRLLAIRPARTLRPVFWLVAAAVLLCAATALWMAMRTETKPREIATPPSERAAPSIARAGTPPTWLAYTRAAAVSPEELDRLLAAHEHRLLPAVGPLEAKLPL